MFKPLFSVLLSAALISTSQFAVATDKWSRWHRVYEVSITNITKGQTFTPQLVTAHNKKVSLYTLGEPASDELATLAESGATGPLTEKLLEAGNAVTDIQTIAGLLAPGQTVTVDILANPFSNVLSIGAMLIPTNDTFVGGDSLRFPRRGSATYYLQALDAGSEYNDQNCANIPGPRCGGAGDSAPAETDEGFVHISNGFHDLGEADEQGNEILGPFAYDWRNPVAKVVVKRAY